MLTSQFGVCTSVFTCGECQTGLYRPVGFVSQRLLGCTAICADCGSSCTARTEDGQVLLTRLPGFSGMVMSAGILTLCADAEIDVAGL